MAKPSDPANQLHLHLVFTNPHPAVVKMAEVLTDIADAPPDVAAPPEAVPSSSPPCPSVLDLATRQRIKRTAMILSLQSGNEPHVVWVMAYHDLHKLTGFHAVAEAARLRLPAHLDALFTDAAIAAGLPEKMLELLARKLEES